MAPVGGSAERVLRTFDASGFVLTEKLFPARARMVEHAHDHARFCFVVAGHYTEAIAPTGPRLRTFNAHLLRRGRIALERVS
jgi:hypothetical protein